MPPSQAFKQLQKEICELGYEIQINQIDRYSDKFTPPGISTKYEVLHWENGKPKRELYISKKIDLFFWLENKLKELKNGR